MADTNQASLFALKGVCNSQPLVASIAGMRHVEGQEVFLQSKVVPKLFFRQDVATVAMGDYGEEGPGHASTFEAPGQGRLSSSQFVKVGLFTAEAVPPGAVVGSADLQPVIAKMEGFSLHDGGHKHAGCLAGCTEVHPSGFDWVSNPYARLFDTVCQCFPQARIDVGFAEIEEGWKEVCADGFLKRFKIARYVGADAGGILSFALQAECKARVGGLGVVHSLWLVIPLRPPMWKS